MTATVMVRGKIHRAGEVIAVQERDARELVERKLAEPYQASPAENSPRAATTVAKPVKPAKRTRK
jgi:hypothetical protein